MSDDVFHAGERLVQARAGVQVRGAPIRTAMPEQHRLFFAGLPVLFVGAADPAGAPIATVLEGPSGFVASPDPTCLLIAATPGAGDPAESALRPGAEVGLLGLDFASRRRNRANGLLDARGPEGLMVQVRQSFGNCPQYIHRREPAASGGVPGPVRALTGLDDAARAIVAAADTLFVASSSGPAGGAQGGVDMSHRGGPAGFVTVDGDRVTIPDYRGNRYFNTLGNLVLEPRVALLFVDFASGGVLHLQGRAEIAWGDGGATSWSVDVARAWLRVAALPLRWTDL